MKKTLSLILLLFLGWVFATPWLTLLSIKGAIKERNSAALSRYIDLPALKHSLKSEMGTILVEKTARMHSGSGYANVLSAAASRTALKTLDPLIDVVLTPEAIIELFRADVTDDKDASDDKGVLSPILPKGEIEYSSAYDDFDAFSLTMKRKNGGNEQLSIIFRRNGLFTWKASAIALPR
ncbi:MAG: DUF2939 domain-containing protein [Azoarcus sp.]|jgi:hypothetical protein|nr:DUF2939 domain-containing protein [Azoarcus sp.]